MTRQTAMAFIITLTALNTRATGRMTNNMERVTNHGPMAVSSRDPTLNLRKRAGACTHGQMATSTSETGKTI